MKSQKKVLSYISSIGMLISIFLPWLSVKSSGSMSFGGYGAESGSLSGSINGIEGNLVIYGFFILILSGLGIFFTFRPIKSIKSISFIIGCISSLLSLLLLFHLIGVTSRYGGDMDFHSSVLTGNVNFESKTSNGFGLYLLLISSMVFAFINFDKNMFSNLNFNNSNPPSSNNIKTNYIQTRSDSSANPEYYSEVKAKPQEIYIENITNEIPHKHALVDDTITKPNSNRSLIIGFAIIIILLVSGFSFYIIKNSNKDTVSLPPTSNEAISKSEPLNAPIVEQKSEAINQSSTNIQAESKEQTTNNELEDSYIIISEKAYFHNEPNNETTRKGYLIKGQQIHGIKTKNGFVYCEYTNDKEIVTSGWLQISDIEKMEKQ